MRVIQLWLKRIAKLGLILMMGVSMSACSRSWKEEVQLHDGSKIIVARSVDRGGRHEIGQSPPIKEQSLAFTLPVTNEGVTWKTAFSEDIGLADFKPILLDIVQDRVYIVATPMGCLSYNKWGRPNPPYVLFRYEGKEWKRIQLSELPLEIKTPNLIISSPDDEAERVGKSLIPAETIKQLNGELTQPEYKTILREPYQYAAGGCYEMVYYKGMWVGPGDSTGKRMMDRKTK
ncbi:MAG: hypothetical protein PHP85_10805 [Gallionella sp.]|nr:hypothetical protein [Gallionella sp.]